MRRLEGWRAAFLAAWIATAMTACSDLPCPKGYYKEGKTCYHLKDAGPDGQAADGDDEPDSGSDSDSEDSEGDAASLDGAPEPADAAGVDSQSSAPDVPLACTGKCGEHEVCTAGDGNASCACAPGYSACQPSCKDLMSDPLNCGACGYACAEGLTCKQGQCEQRIRELVLDAAISCALYESADGNFPLKCWGDATGGLFRNGLTEALSPREVAGMPRVRALALTGPRYCAVIPGQDAVRCWGECGLECGNPAGTTTTGSAFSHDVSLPGIGRISGAGGEGSAGNTCALTGTGDVWCWGAGRLIGANDDRAYPQGTIKIDNYSTFSGLNGGSIHTCAVGVDGRVGCWGTVDNGVLGIATSSFPMGTQWSPGVFVQKESGGTFMGATKVEVGSTSCAITGTGELWCWGPNEGAWRTPAGILGVGDVVGHAGAVKVALDGVSDVALGWGGQACAIARGGQVYCWGTTNFVGLGAGAVGDAETGSAFTKPQAVPGLNDAVEIKAGLGHTCARKRNGQVLCWGQNASGELGDGTKVQRLTPTPVVGLY